MINDNHVLLSADGFEISSYHRDSLAELGSRVFLRYTGYLNQTDIHTCLKKTPARLQSCVTTCLSVYKQRLIEKKELVDEKSKFKVSLITLTLSNVGGYTLFITTEWSEELPIIKSILCNALYS